MWVLLWRSSWCCRGTLSLESYASVLIMFCLKKPLSLSTVRTVSTNSLLPKNATTGYTKLCLILNWGTSLTEVKPALLPVYLTYSWSIVNFSWKGVVEEMKEMSKIQHKADIALPTSSLTQLSLSNQSHLKQSSDMLKQLKPFALNYP